MEKSRFFSRLFLVLILFLSFFASDLPSKINRINLLLITIDTLRADALGCYGAKEPATPNIDSLTQGGILFSRAFAHTPTTLPSHTNILLGATPPFHGVHDNANFIVRPEFLTLAEWLKNRGYSTGAFVGAFPLDSRFGLTQGFDVYDDNYGAQGPQDVVFVERKAEAVIEKACTWLQEQKGAWFCWVHLFDPHQRYDPPEPYKSRYQDNLYAGEVAYVDFALGRLLSFLKEKKWDSTTAIVFTGDHGESLGEHGEMTHGYFAYNSTLWVPLIISYPGAKPGQNSWHVCHADIFPTVCEILDIDKPAHLQGHSLVPLIRGKTFPRRSIYFESLAPYCNRGWAPLRGYIEDSKKYIDSPIPEVYDLKEDFFERHNLAQSADINALKRNLDRLIKATSSGRETVAWQQIDHETRQKLRSLGYMASPQESAKRFFTAEDDLKALLPYHNKWMKAMVLHQQGKIEEGITLLHEIIAERKDFDLAYTYLANYYKDQKKLPEAEAILMEAYQNNPSSFRIITAYAIFFIDTGKYNRALEFLEIAKSIVDYDPEVWNYIGVAFWNKGDYEQALQAYARALALDHNYPVVFNNLGSLYLSIYLKTGSAEANRMAIDKFRQAIRLDPKYASAYNGLGAALKFAGDLDGAIENWKMAINLKPDYGFAIYNLGLTYFAKGNKEQALSYFSKYKAGFYQSLSKEEKEKLDTLIEKCKWQP